MTVADEQAAMADIDVFQWRRAKATGQRKAGRSGSAAAASAVPAVRTSTCASPRMGAGAAPTFPVARRDTSGAGR